MDSNDDEEEYNDDDDDGDDGHLKWYFTRWRSLAAFKAVHQSESRGKLKIWFRDEEEENLPVWHSLFFSRNPRPPWVLEIMKKLRRTNEKPKRNRNCVIKSILPFLPEYTPTDTAPFSTQTSAEKMLKTTRTKKEQDERQTVKATIELMI